MNNSGTCARALLRPLARAESAFDINASCDSSTLVSNSVYGLAVMVPHHAYLCYVIQTMLNPWCSAFIDFS